MATKMELGLIASIMMVAGIGLTHGLAPEWRAESDTNTSKSDGRKIMSWLDKNCEDVSVLPASKLYVCDTPSGAINTVSIDFKKLNWGFMGQYDGAQVFATDEGRLAREAGVKTPAQSGKNVATFSFHL